MINNLFRFADEHDILMVETPLKKAVALAVMDENNNCCIGIDSSKLVKTGEKCVAIAHELGHCEKGAFYNSFTPFDLRSRHEYRADCWAFEHLVSRENLDNAVAQGNTEMWQLAEYFDIPQSYMEKIVRHHNGLEW